MTVRGASGVLVGLVLAVGCGAPTAPDAGLVPDAGNDAGPGPDAGSDAGADAGAGDAGAPDAGPPDAGPPDSGSQDAGPDAGVDGGNDGGVPDAGTPDAGCGCDAGVCLSDGGCGQCELDRHCTAPRPFCELPTNTCVECRTTSDTCDAGLYCLSSACVPGCKGDSACASGVCLPTHDCFNCRGDQECAAGRLCGTGTCTAACSSSCAGGGLCCGNRCIDESRDPLHCGDCITACAMDQFCGRGACVADTVSNACQAQVATTLLDGLVIDNSAGVTISSALGSSCTPAVTVRQVNQGDSGVLDVVTGEPLQLGELLVAGGGSFRQRAVAWFEAQNLAPVHDTSTSTVYQYTLRDGGVIVQGALATITPSHDIFVLQLARTPGGAVALNAAGFYAEGTTAAAWYFANRVVPVLSTQTDTWYVVDWVDANANLVPDTADTWTVLASGR